MVLDRSSLTEMRATIKELPPGNAQEAAAVNQGSTGNTYLFCKPLN